MLDILKHVTDKQNIDCRIPCGR